MSNCVHVCEQKKNRGRGADGLHQHRPGEPWCFSYRGTDGLRHHKSTRTTSQREAKAARSAFLQAQAQGTLPGDLADLTVREALLARFDAMDAVGKPSAWQRRMALPVIALIGGKRLRDLGRPELERYRVLRMKEESPTTHRRLSACTVNLELQPIVALMKEANLDSRIRGFRRLPEQQSLKGKVITEAQEDQLLALVPEHPEWAAAIFCVTLMCNCGARGGELRKLQLRHIDMERRQLMITRENTKSNAGERRIPLGPRALWIVARLLELAANRGSTAPDHYLLARWVQRDGKGAWDPTRGAGSLQTSWSKARAAIGLDARVHDGRHTFITRLAQASVPIATAMSLVGHMSPAVLRHYQHTSSEDMKAAVEAVNRPLPAGLQSTGQGERVM